MHVEFVGQDLPWYPIMRLSLHRERLCSADDGRWSRSIRSQKTGEAPQPTSWPALHPANLLGRVISDALEIVYLLEC
jgi:hypothetical protein